ncbi:MAG: YcgN family cysteine cluster protein, partial [Halieaceae bacterium]
DGCGQCCLHKLVNDDTGDVFYTRVACRLLDPESGRCGRYAQRLEIVEDCLDVRQMRRAELSWMPRTCAYRRLAEGKPLPNWHPLLTGTSDSVRTAGLSIAGRTISEQAAKLDDLETEIIDWVEI